MPDTLQQAIAAIKSGNKAHARELLTYILESDPRNEQAWIWLSRVATNEMRRRTCLQQALTINPNSVEARRAMLEWVLLDEDETDAAIVAKKPLPSPPPTPSPIPAAGNLNEFRQKLSSNYNILREREAKYATAAPLDLLNQIDDYEYALTLVEQAIKQDASLAELQDEFSSLNLQMSGVVFVAQEPPRKPFTGVSPYIGLRKFTEEEAKFFFGRSSAIQGLLDLVGRLVETETSAQVPDLVAVLGASGSGKSSLVRAGLIPALRQGRLPGSKQWPVKVMVPGAHPLDALAELFIDPIGWGLGDIRQTLEEGEEALHSLMTEAMARQPEDSFFVLVIDQFEEVFSMCEDEQERQRFLDQLMYSCQIPHNRGFIILTMRADFYAEAGHYKHLADAITKNQMLVAPMTERELREAILQPAEAVGLELEKDVVQALVYDTVEAPGALPLLQHALQELFDRRDGNLLTMQAYREVGGIRGALAHRADSVMDSLSLEQQQIARRIFLRLIRPGEGTGDTRRRIAFKQVLTHKVSPDNVESIVRTLTNASLLVTSRNPETEEVMLDVTHEALIREWPRLRAWLEEDREILQLRLGIEAAAKEWANATEEEKKNLVVHRGGRLEDIEQLIAADRLALDDQEDAYIQACIDLRDRAARESEARNLAFVVNDLLRKDLTKAIRMAQAAYCLDREHNLPQVSGALSKAYYSAIQTQSSFYVANLPHEGAVHVVAFSHDGQKVVTASSDHTARLWDSRGRLLQTMEQGDRVIAATFAPDNGKIVTAGYGYGVKMWDGSGHFLKDLEGHGPAEFDNVTSIAFASDSRTIVTVGADHKVIVWSGDGQLQTVITDHQDVIGSVTFSLNGQYFITCGLWRDSTARLYNRSGTLLAELGLDDGPSKREHHWQWGISSAVFSPDSELIVTTSHDFTAKMWDIAGNHLKTLDTHAAEVNQAAFSADGRWFATVSNDGTAIIWDREGNLHRRLEGHDTAVKRLAFAPHDNLLITGDEHGEVNLWNLEGQLLANLNGHNSTINALSFSPDGAYAVTASSDRTAKIWKVLPPTQRKFQHDSEVVAAYFSPAGPGRQTAPEILTASNDLTVKRWQARTGELLNTYSDFGADVYDNKRIFSLDVAPDGQRFVTTGTDYFIRIWDLTSGDIVNQWDSREGNSCNDGGWCGAQNARYAPDGQSIITADFGGQVKLWDRAGRLIKELQERQPNEVAGVAVSYDNRYIATGCHDHVIRLWDFESGALIGAFSGHRGPVYHVDFAPDGRSLLSASADYTAKLWDLEGNILLNLNRHAHEVRMAIFSPDGQTILTASSDTTAKLWDLNGKLVNTIEGHSKWLRSAVFGPGGRTVLTASGDGSARLWPLADIIYTELGEAYGDIYQLTEADLEEVGLDVTICAPCIWGSNRGFAPAMRK